ncbi:MAG: tetratricopeptide repeat protein [Gemmatimonadota bacterium]
MKQLRVARRFLPAALLATGACFATRSDVRVLQADLLAFRHESARADSARARQTDAIAAVLGVVADSMRDISARLGRFQGDTRGELRAMGDQLLQLGELVGQSQVAIQRMRAEQDLRAMQQASMPQIPQPVVGDSTTPRPPPAAAEPGPSLMFAEGLAQFQRGSFGAAQTVFEDLLRLHPSADVVPDAMYFLAESYDAGGTPERADTMFLRTVTRFPTSPRASASLYKMGLSLAKRGQRPEARAAMDRLVRQYPRSDEAEFAREWLAANR